MRRRRLHHAMIAFALLAATVNCSSKGDGDTRDSAGSVDVAFGGAASKDLDMHAGDVRIVSTDGVLVLSIIGDTVRMQLSDSLRQAVGADIVKDGDTSGFAGMITKTVSKAVTSAMAFMVRVPATEVQNLRFDNGHIRFETRNSQSKFRMNGDNDQNAVFTEADAKRFIDAVNKRAARMVAM